jgi:hypothetical protein
MTIAGWDFEQKSNSKKNEYTKFPEGITRIRIVDDAPLMRWTHWIPTAKRAVNCPGKGCPICEIRKQQKANKQPQTYSVGRRLVITIINRETKKVEILEQGVTFFEDIKDIMIDLSAKGKSLSDFDLRVKRRGMGQQDTTYRIDIDEEYPLTDEDLKLLEDRPDLTELTKPHDADKILRIIQGEKWEDVFYNKEDIIEDNIELS